MAIRGRHPTLPPGKRPALSTTARRPFPFVQRLASFWIPSCFHGPFTGPYARTKGPFVEHSGADYDVCRSYILSGDSRILKSDQLILCLLLVAHNNPPDAIECNSIRN